MKLLNYKKVKVNVKLKVKEKRYKRKGKKPNELVQGVKRNNKEKKAQPK